MAQLEYEVAYYNSTVHCFNYYTTRTPPLFSLGSLDYFTEFVVFIL